MFPRQHQFMGLELIVDGSVLAPRAETELLGRTALLLLLTCWQASPLVIDMCCGSGNIGCALAAAVPQARILAADLTDDTVKTTRLNAARLGLARRLRVCQGDLFGALVGEGAENGAAMIVCNPPYISSSKLAGDSAYLLEDEPRAAFDGGPYGISVQQRLVREAPGFLQPGGLLLFEFGIGQEKQAALLLRRAGCYTDIDLVTNEAGQPRVAVARFNGDAP